MNDDVDIRSACEEYRYASPVFLAPAWREIYETDDERKQNWEEAERTCAVVAETYRECGYEVLELPRLDPKQRANFMAEHLASRFGIPIPSRKQA
jgi:predicted ATPase